MSRKARAQITITDISDGEQYFIELSQENVVIPSNSTYGQLANCTATFWKKTGNGAKTAASMYCWVYARKGVSLTLISSASNLSQANSSHTFSVNSDYLTTSYDAIVVYIYPTQGGFNPNSQYYAKKEIAITKNGDKGNKGDDGVAYALTCSPAAVNFRRNAAGEFATAYINVSCEVKKSLGGTISDVTPGSGSGVYLFYRKLTTGSAQAWTQRTSASASQSVSYAEASAATYAVTGLEYALTSNNSTPNNANVLARTTVPVMLDGMNGDPGSTGKGFYSAGQWNDQTKYTANEYECPLVWIDAGSGGREWYYLPEGESTNQNPKQAGTPGNPWKRAQNNWNVILTEALFADFASFQSAVITGDWLISKHGFCEGGVVDDERATYLDGGVAKPYYLKFDPTDPKGETTTNFKPNFALDLKTGALYGSKIDISGTIHAENFFHNVCFFNGSSYSRPYYRYLGEQTQDYYSKFVKDQYYTREQVYSLSGGQLDNDDPTGFEKSTGNADIIVTFIFRDNNSIRLSMPSPDDFPGKMVQLFSYTYGNVSTDHYYVDGHCMSNAATSLTNNGTVGVDSPSSESQVHIGGSATYISTKLTQKTNGHEYVWLLLENKTGGDIIINGDPSMSIAVTSVVGLTGNVTTQQIVDAIETAGYELTDNNNTYRLTLNGTQKGTPGGADLGSFYAPMAIGSDGQFLKSTGSGAPSWSALPTATTSAAGIVQLGTGAEQAAKGDHSHNFLIPLAGGNIGSASGNNYLWIKRASKTADGTPNNGLVLEYGGSATWTGQLYFADNGKDGVYFGGWYNGERVAWNKLAFVTDTVANAANATNAGNADTVDGRHASDFLLANGMYTENNGISDFSVNFPQNDNHDSNMDVDFQGGSSYNFDADVFINNKEVATKSWVSQNYALKSELHTHSNKAVLDSITEAMVTKLNGIEAGANKYTHPTNGANTTIAAADGRVLSAITVNNLGHVTSVSYKALSNDDIPGTLTLNALTVSGAIGGSSADFDSLTKGGVNVATVNDIPSTSNFLLINTAGGIASVSGGGDNWYFKIATINITSAYINRPVVFEISQRGYEFSLLQVIFNSINGTDPTLRSFTTNNVDVYYIKKVATSKWEIYGRYYEVWGKATIHRITGCGADIGVTVNMVNIGMEPPSDTTQCLRNYQNKLSFVDTKNNNGTIDGNSIGAIAFPFTKSVDGKLTLDLSGITEQYKGTVTGISVNGGSPAGPDANGVVSLGTLLNSLSVATGTNNGTIKYAVNGGNYTEVAVKGLQALAYKGSLAFTDLSSHPTTLSGYGITDAAAASHTHGSITNDGKISDGTVSIGVGDVLLITDNSKRNKIVRSNITFNGSDKTKALTPAGTFETFLTQHQSLADYVTLSTTQQITGAKTFTSTIAPNGGITPIASGTDSGQTNTRVNTASGNSRLWIKKASREGDGTPNNGVVLEYGNSTSWVGQLYMGDNATQGLYWNGWSDGERGEWKKIAFVTDTVANATNAGNADTLDGVHANGLFTNLSNTNDGNLSLTIGGTTKTLAIVKATNAYEADLLGSSTVGSTTKGIYLSNGSPAEMTYSLGSTVDAGTLNRIAYYKGPNEIAANGYIAYIPHTETAAESGTLTNGKKYIDGLRLWGTTVGNLQTVNGSSKPSTISGKTGDITFGDGGPQIQFSTGANTAQDGAIIFTDHDSAGAGASFHFVSNQADWNVHSKRFVARDSVTIGYQAVANGAYLPNTNYALFVGGSALITGNTYIGSVSNDNLAATQGWVTDKGYQTNAIEKIVLSGSNDANKQELTGKTVTLPLASTNKSGVVMIGDGLKDFENHLTVDTAWLTNQGFTKGSYLPLSGGTLSNANRGVLALAQTGVQSTDAGVGPYITFRIGNSDVGYFGYNTSSGFFMQLAGVKTFKITPQGELQYDNQKVWYAGNDGSGSGLNADLLDGRNGAEYAMIGCLATDIANNTDLNNIVSAGTYTCQSSGIATTLGNTPYTGGNFRLWHIINTGTDGNANSQWSAQMLLAPNAARLFLRSHSQNAFGSWREFAFKDSTVTSVKVGNTPHNPSNGQIDLSDEYDRLDNKFDSYLPLSGGKTITGTVTMNSVLNFGSDLNAGIQKSSNDLVIGNSNGNVLINASGLLFNNKQVVTTNDLPKTQHNATGTSGTAGWIKIANISIGAGWKNQPITFHVTQRRQVGVSYLTLLFTPNESASTTVQSFIYFGGSLEARVANASLGTTAANSWNLFIKKSEPYDNIGISLVDKGNYMDGVSVTWTNTHYSDADMKYKGDDNVEYYYGILASYSFKATQVEGYLPLTGGTLTGALKVPHLFEVYNGNSSTKQSAYMRFTRNGVNGNDYAALGWNGSNVRLCILGGNGNYTSERDALLIGYDGQLKLQASNGTAPITTSSTTLVTNLNADTVDGKHASDFLLKTGGIITGTIKMKMDRDSSNAKSALSWINTQEVTIGEIQFHNTAKRMIFNASGATEIWNDTANKYSFIVGENELTYNTYKIWHAGNDGSDSGLDADMLDGQHGSYYATKSALDSYLPLSGGKTITGSVTMNSVLNFGSDLNAGIQKSSNDLVIGNSNGNVQVNASGLLFNNKQVATINDIANINAAKLDGWTKSQIQKTSYVTSGTAGLSSYWCKAWDITITNERYSDKDVVVLVSSAFNYLWGIIAIKVRQNGVNGSGAYQFENALRLITGNIPADRFRLYYSNTTGKCELWCNVSAQWGNFNFTVLKKIGNRVDVDSADVGTWYNTNFTAVREFPASSNGFAYIEMSYLPIMGNINTSGAISIDRSDAGVTAKGTQYGLVKARMKNSGTGTYSYNDVISLVGAGETGTTVNNLGVRLGSQSGMTWISAGENGTAFSSAVSDICNTENMYLTADGSINFYTGVQNNGTGGKRTLLLNSDGSMNAIGQMIFNYAFSGTNWASDYGAISIRTTAASNPYMIGFAANSDGYGEIQASQQGIGGKPLVLQKMGGNVGIGTTNPAYKLDVSGSARVTGNLSVGGIQATQGISVGGTSVSLEGHTHSQYLTSSDLNGYVLAENLPYASVYWADYAGSASSADYATSAGSATTATTANALKATTLNYWNGQNSVDYRMIGQTLMDASDSQKSGWLTLSVCSRHNGAQIVAIMYGCEQTSSDNFKLANAFCEIEQHGTLENSVADDVLYCYALESSGRIQFAFFWRHRDNSPVDIRVIASGGRAFTPQAYSGTDYNYTEAQISTPTFTNKYGQLFAKGQRRVGMTTAWAKTSVATWAKVWDIQLSQESENTRKEMLFMVSDPSSSAFGLCALRFTHKYANNSSNVKVYTVSSVSLEMIYGNLTLAQFEAFYYTGTTTGKVELWCRITGASRYFNFTVLKRTDNGACDDAGVMGMWYNVNVTSALSEPTATTTYKKLVMTQKSVSMSMSKLNLGSAVFDEGYGPKVEFTRSNSQLGFTKTGSSTLTYYFDGPVSNNSDSRLKTIDKYIEPSVYDIAFAPLVAFRWKNGDSRQNVGTIAQYWEKVLPQAVHENSDGFLSLEYSTIALAAGVTASRKAVDNERRIIDLERELTALRARVAELEQQEIEN